MEELYALIRQFEGLRLKRYLCPAGVWTIGYGHTGSYTKTDAPINQATAEALLRVDALRSTRDALNLSPGLVRFPGALASISSFIYNLGVSRYRVSTLRKKVNAEDWKAARKELMKWTYGGGRKLPGLVRRRAAECALLPE